MSRIEEALLRRFSGIRIVIGSFCLGLLGYLPLQLYIWFGPTDGNPIGLGLLAFVAVPFAAVGVMVGTIKVLVEFFHGKEK